MSLALRPSRRVMRSELRLIRLLFPADRSVVRNAHARLRQLYPESLDLARENQSEDREELSWRLRHTYSSAGYNHRLEALSRLRAERPPVSLDELYTPVLLPLPKARRMHQSPAGKADESSSAIRADWQRWSGEPRSERPDWTSGRQRKQPSSKRNGSSWRRGQRGKRRIADRLVQQIADCASLLCIPRTDGSHLHRSVWSVGRGPDWPANRTTQQRAGKATMGSDVLPVDHQSACLHDRHLALL